MSERIRQELLRRITSGIYGPGTRLVEMQIAREFQTSQGPVREALREIEGMGLVTTEPYKGTRVREVTMQEIAEAYLVRAPLEDLASRLSAPHFKGNVARLEKAANSALAAAKANDVHGYVRHNIQFHRLIVHASQNSMLIRIWDLLSFEVGIQFRLTREGSNLVEAQEDHWEIIAALKEGDGKRAGKLTSQHILRNCPDLTQAWLGIDPVA